MGKLSDRGGRGRGAGAGGQLFAHTDAVTRVCVGVEGNADCFQASFCWGHITKHGPAFIKKDGLQLRPFKKPYKEATNLHQRGFGTGSGGGVRKG